MKTFTTMVELFDFVEQFFYFWDLGADKARSGRAISSWLKFVKIELIFIKLYEARR